jgi:phosphoribosylformylglycinamidine synthase
MKFGVIVFPASNCDIDMYYLLKEVYKKDVDTIWHTETDVSQYDIIILPGGFSYGDYLRCGAMSAQSPIMESVEKHAQKGKLVLGVCNGFQVLTERRMLPGALIQNENIKFICDEVYVRVENNKTPFTNQGEVGQLLKIPIAHGEGNYIVDEKTLEEMENNGQILFRYCSESGDASKEYNPNGSISNIAGITNKEGNVLGMMPHPERCGEELLGNVQGKLVFDSIINYLEKKGE